MPAPRGFESPPEVQQQHLKDICESNKPLVDRKVLIVDDDVRNIYALSSVLEDYGMNIVAADTAGGMQSRCCKSNPILTPF